MIVRQRPHRVRVFDRRGRYLGDVPSIGSSIFEFFHPGAVQQEYQAEGKIAPSSADVMTQAASDIGGRISENVQGAVQAAESAGRWIVVGLVAVAVVGVVAVFRKRR